MPTLVNKIIINGRFLNQRITGVQRYAIELIKALDHLIDAGKVDTTKYSFFFLTPKNISKKLQLKHILLKQVGCLRGHLWEQMELPIYAQKGLLVSLCNSSPLLKSDQIVTIHDASVFAFPRAYRFLFRFYYRILLKVLAKIAKRIITVSSFSKSELIRYIKVSKHKVSVTYLGTEHILSIPAKREILEKYDLVNKPYILAVSSINPNKNFESILRAIEILGDIDLNLVIAGENNSNIFSQLPVLLSSNKIKLVGYVNDSELRALYETAMCFVYPSFYEGFGLPPLEAMACGCPVIVSNTSSLPEICGDAVLYCDPHSPEDIAQKISQLRVDLILQKKLKQKGLERAQQFSWKKCANEMLEEIKKHKFK